MKRRHNFVGDPEHQCKGKKAYRDKAGAKRAIRRMRYTHNRSRLVAYRCPHCDAFHVGGFH